MSRPSYVHHQEDYIVHAALCGMFSMRLCKQLTRLKDVLHVQYILLLLLLLLLRARQLMHRKHLSLRLIVQP
jgi:hypothetical protein